MTVDDIPITPAVCGICDGLPREYIKANWDALRAHVFRKEKEIYDVALLSCSVAHARKGNREMGYNIFAAVLIGEYANGFDFKKNNGVAMAIFEKYWDLAKRDEFWASAREVPRSAVPYSRALEIWQANFKEDINFCLKSLKAWLTNP
jgi:hypothetical protein